jgi:hypothetical protein
MLQQVAELRAENARLRAAAVAGDGAAGAGRAPASAAADVAAAAAAARAAEATAGAAADSAAMHQQLKEFTSHTHMELERKLQVGVKMYGLPLSST